MLDDPDSATQEAEVAAPGETNETALDEARLADLAPQEPSPDAPDVCDLSPVVDCVARAPRNLARRAAAPEGDMCAPKQSTEEPDRGFAGEEDTGLVAATCFAPAPATS